MSAITFHPVPQSNQVFDVAIEGEVVGIAWRMGAVWFASTESLRDLTIMGATREEAATRLVETLGST